MIEIEEAIKHEWITQWEEYAAARPVGTWVSYLGVHMCVIRAGSAWIGSQFCPWSKKIYKSWNVLPILCEYVDDQKHFITKEFNIEMLDNKIPLEPQ